MAGTDVSAQKDTENNVSRFPKVGRRLPFCTRAFLFIFVPRECVADKKLAAFHRWVAHFSLQVKKAGVVGKAPAAHL